MAEEVDKPKPWDKGAFPALCPHCQEVKWYRPGDMLDKADVCWAAIIALCGGRAFHADAASQWWCAIVDWCRRDERFKIADAVLAKARTGPAGETRRKVAVEIRNG